MESKLSFRLIGRYSITQAHNEECMRCKKAHFATILVRMDDDEQKNWMCIECLLRERLYYQLLSEHRFSVQEARDTAFKKPNKLLDGLG